MKNGVWDSDYRDSLDKINELIAQDRLEKACEVIAKVIEDGEVDQSQINILKKKLNRVKIQISKVVEFNGVSIYERQLQVIHDLQELTNNQFVPWDDKITNVIISNCNVISLNCSGMNLSILPSNLERLHRIKELNLGNNYISEIPNELVEMKDLTFLNLSNNNFSKIGSLICNIHNLEVLDLGRNQIVNVPEEISKLKKLKRLNLNDNRISNLPDGICQLVELQHFNIANNELQSLPDNIGSLKQLETLIIGDGENSDYQLEMLLGHRSTDVNHSNYLHSLPDSIGNLQNLRVLSLGSNKLTELTHAIGNLKQLECLFISDNLLSNLPESIVNLNRLEYLNAANNNITFLPMEINKLQNIREAIFSDNKIKFLPEYLITEDNISALIRSEVDEYDYELPYIFSNNEIEKYPDNFPKIISKYRVKLGFDEKSFSKENFTISLKLFDPKLTQTDIYLPLSTSKLILKQDNLSNENTMKFISEFAKSETQYNFDKHYYNLDRLVRTITHQETYEVWLETDLEYSKILELLKSMLKSPDPQIQQTSSKLFDQWITNRRVTGSNINLEEIQDQKFIKFSKYYSWIYFIIGAVIVTLFKNFVENTDSWFNAVPVQIVVLGFFIFQVYQGITIQEYVDNYLEKIETGAVKLQSLNSSLSKFLFRAFSRLQSSFGVLLTIFAFITILEITNTKLQENIPWEFHLEVLDSIFRTLRNFTEFMFPTKIEIFPQLSMLSSVLFVGFTGILLRCIAILGIFWAIFKGGWSTLYLNPREEDRMEVGVNLDWYEIAALPLGIFVVIIALAIDNSSVTGYPPYLFQIGLIFGALLHLIINRDDSTQMILTTLAIVGLIILGNQYDQIKDLYSHDFTPFMIKSVIIVALLMIWFYPSPSFQFFSKPDIFRFFGRPCFFNFPLKIDIWNWISNGTRLNPNRPGFLIPEFTKPGEIENLSNIIKSYDLGTLVLFLLGYFILPLSAFSYLIQLSTIILSVLLLLSMFVLYFYIRRIGFEGIPSHINNFIKDLLEYNQKESILFYSYISSPNIDLFRFLQNELYSLNLSNMGLKHLPESISELKTLKSIEIQNNNLKTIPSSITKLRQLRYLNISNNHIVHLPETLLKLINLKIVTKGNPLSKSAQSIMKKMKMQYEPEEGSFQIDFS